MQYGLYSVVGFVMRLFFTAAAASIALAGLPISSVMAKPFLYVISLSHTGDYQQCMRNAKEALKKVGINNFYDDVVSEQNRAGKISGYSADEFLSVEVECDQKMGVTAFGVAGLDNDLTYDTYQKLLDMEW